jgi:hypothetical protein
MIATRMWSTQRGTYVSWMWMTRVVDVFYGHIACTGISWNHGDALRRVWTCLYYVFHAPRIVSLVEEFKLSIV